MIWQLIRKDFQRRFKNPGGFLILAALPLVFTLLIGLIFGSSGDKNVVPRVKLLIEDHDDSFVSQFLSGLFGRGQLETMFDVKIVEKGSGSEMMDKGKASALLVIPEGFGDSLLNRGPVALTLIKNPSEAFAPKIAEETVSILVEGADRLIRIGSEPISTIKKQIDTDADFSEAQIATIAIQFHRLINKVETYLFPPLIGFEEKSASVEGEENEKTTSSQLYAAVLSSVIAMFLLFQLEAMARDFFRERENHTLERLLVSPAGLMRFILSKLVFLVMIGLVSYFSVWIVVWVLFGVRIATDRLILFVAFSVVLIVCLVSIISLIYSIIKTRQQGMEISPAVIIVLSMLGGSMISLNALPQFIRRLSVVSPIFWGTDGLNKIVIENLSLHYVAMHLCVLGSISVSFLMVSFVLFYRKFQT